MKKPLSKTSSPIDLAANGRQVSVEPGAHYPFEHLDSELPLGPYLPLEGNGDGGEPTPPSLPEEPVAKPEPLSWEKNINSSPDVTPKHSGDIFDDLDALGRTLDELLPSEKVLVSLEIRKPKKDEWFHCHGEIHTPVNIYENSAQEFHLVLPAVLESMEEVVKHVRLCLAVNYSGDPFVWPIPVPSPQKPHSSHVSAARAAEAAKAGWIRMAWKKAASCYEVYRRPGSEKEPLWPVEIKTASEMLRFVSKAGGFEIIDSIDHPVVRELRGLS